MTPSSMGPVVMTAGETLTETEAIALVRRIFPGAEVVEHPSTDGDRPERPRVALIAPLPFIGDAVSPPTDPPLVDGSFQRTMSARQRWAIHRSRAERQKALAPLRVEVAEVISLVGWRQARPVVENVLGLGGLTQRGWWWSRLGKRNGARILTELRALAEGTRQMTLFDGETA